MNKPAVFIHTSSHEILSAKVAMYSHKRTSKNLDKFDIKLIQLEDYPHLTERHGKTCIRKGRKSSWYKDVPQSFLPLRFLVPQLMGYKGRAVLTDPDIFAVSDVYELLNRDMRGKAIISRPVSKNNKTGDKLKAKAYNSSVMLLDCNQLRHWRWEEQINDVFSGKRDLQDWIWLQTESEDSIGSLEEEWNHYDTLNKNTKLLHNTRQITQPWKTGLPYRIEDMNNHKKTIKDNIINWTKYSLFLKKIPVYKEHPDPRQENLFLCLLKECLSNGFVEKELIVSEIQKGHIRSDIFKRLNSVNFSVDDVLEFN